MEHISMWGVNRSMHIDLVYALSHTPPTLRVCGSRLGVSRRIQGVFNKCFSATHSLEPGSPALSGNASGLTPAAGGTATVGCLRPCRLLRLLWVLFKF